MFDKFDFSPGIITNNDFDIDPNSPLDDDNLSLKEDMLQVKFPSNLVIDVGWYGVNNKFIMYIIKDCDWEEPVFKGFYSNLEDLKSGMDECVKKVKKLIP